MRLFLDLITYQNKPIVIKLGYIEDGYDVDLDLCFDTDIARSDLSNLGIDPNMYNASKDSFENQIFFLVRLFQRHNTIVGFNILKNIEYIEALFKEYAPEFDFYVKAYSVIDLKAFFETYVLNKSGLRNLFNAGFEDDTAKDRNILNSIINQFDISDSDSDIQSKTIGDGHTIPGRFFDVKKDKQGHSQVYFNIGKHKGKPVTKTKEHISYMRWWLEQDNCTSAEKSFIKALMK